MWDAIASLAWTALAAFVLYKLWPALSDLLKKDGTTIKVGSLELTIPQATHSIGKNVSDLQERLAALEARLGGDRAHTSVEKEPAEEVLPKRLLWVDDFPSNNAFIIEHLKERGIETILSLSTKDAIDKLKSHSFRAIITDLGREENGIDNPYAGIDLIRAIRSSQNEVPILVFAGKRGLDHKREILEAGAEEVTSSGVDVIQFVEEHLVGRP